MFDFHNRIWREQHELVFAQGNQLRLPRAVNLETTRMWVHAYKFLSVPMWINLDILTGDLEGELLNMRCILIRPYASSDAPLLWEKLSTLGMKFLNSRGKSGLAWWDGTQLRTFCSTGAQSL